MPMNQLPTARDAEIKTLLRTCANPLFRVAEPDVNLIHIVVPRDAAINSFGRSGNRMFAGPPGPLPAASPVPAPEHQKGC